MKTTSTNRKEKQTNPIRRNAGIIGVAMMTIFMTTTISFAQRTNVGNGVNVITTEAVEKNPIAAQPVKSIPGPIGLVACPNLTSFTMIDKSFDKVIFGWDNSAGYDSITIRYALSGTTNYRSITMGANPNPGFYILQGLVPQTTYDFDYSAQCTIGGSSIWSTPITITTFAEPAPRLANTNTNNNQRNFISLKVNPNPAISSTVISYVAPVNSSNLIIITTTAGREVYKTTEICTAGKVQHAVDVTNLTPGLYFVRVFIGTNMSVERLIVQ